MTRWLSAARVYFEPRVLAILFLGFSSGLPLALTGSTLQAWMSEEGVSLTTIGGFVLLAVPYNVKFLWAPLIDAVRLPVLTRLLGHRRAWLLTTQLLLMLSVVGLGNTDPATNLGGTALLAFVVAFCSASQDVVIDAFRIESLGDDRQAAGMANYVFGYRIAMLVAGAGALELSSRFQRAGYPGSTAWLPTYGIMACLVTVGVLTVLLCPEPAGPLARQTRPLGARFFDAVVNPFLDFARRADWLLVLLFVALFKFGDAFAGNMTVPFILDIGFDKTDYARVGKLFGFAATLLGGFAGGYVYRIAGTVRSLWIAGLVQMASNLLFVWQAEVGARLGALIVTIGVENFTGGLGTVVFVAYLSSLCRNRTYTATQYALLSALAAVGRTFLSSSAGWFAEQIGWVGFFLLTTTAAVPGLALLWVLTRRGAVVDVDPDSPAGDTAPA